MLQHKQTLHLHRIFFQREDWVGFLYSNTLDILDVASKTIKLDAIMFETNFLALDFNLPETRTLAIVTLKIKHKA